MADAIITTVIPHYLLVRIGGEKGVQHLTPRNNSHTQNNTKQCLQRNCAICVNKFCPDISEHPINMERCPQCNRPLSKTMAQNPDSFGVTNQFELIPQEVENIPTGE